MHFLGECLYSFSQILKGTYDPRMFEKHDWLSEALRFHQLLLFLLEFWALVLICRPWSSSLFPVWFLCQLSSMCCALLSSVLPLGWTNLFLAFLTPFHIPQSWHRRCSCSIYFPSTFSPIWVSLEFLSECRESLEVFLNLLLPSLVHLAHPRATAFPKG